LEVRSRLTRRRAESATFELWCITSHSDMIVVWRNQAFALTIWVLSANACFRQLCCSIAVKEAHHEQTHSDNCVRNSDRFVTDCILTRRSEVGKYSQLQGKDCQSCGSGRRALNGADVRPRERRLLTTWRNIAVALTNAVVSAMACFRQLSGRTSS